VSNRHHKETGLTVDSSRPLGGVPLKNLSGSSAPSIRMHPYDIYTILEQVPTAKLLAIAEASTINTVVINGVTYIEDTSIAPTRRLDL
jgi:hypothetical protein